MHIKIHENDNVEVNADTGHKRAVCDINRGENIIKYGVPIGHALCGIKKGEHIHSHNMATNLSGIVEYNYEPVIKVKNTKTQKYEIKAYRRNNGDIGIRNDIWIINTVGCVNKTAHILAQKTGAFDFPHPFGCSQLGEDHKTTQKILKGLIEHPNAGGVLVLGLGCENNNIGEMKKILGDYDGDRIKFLNVQESDDEIEDGVRIISGLKKHAEGFERESVPLSELCVGLKCGGSDGLSGITANPLVGRFSDMLINAGGSAVLTEVPEMFGAEHILMNRCESREVFDKTVSLINNFKKYFMSYNQPVYENPSPGNKAGGITTLEEKSLGCVQKGGASIVTDVLDMGERVRKKGLSLLNGPGNDMVAVTNLTAAGCHLILFTTGRGTPLGAPVPTVKISSNSGLYMKKRHWTDFDAGGITEGKQLDESFFEFVMRVASGEPVNNEKNGYREISVFKNGVTL
ncbi:MAG: altronate dehydratase [Oscillospiraceae bacterium]|nr:altronate dehydratase [Oscillospiraceae bacterium]